MTLEDVKNFIVNYEFDSCSFAECYSFLFNFKFNRPRIQDYKSYEQFISDFKKYEIEYDLRKNLMDTLTNFVVYEFMTQNGYEFYPKKGYLKKEAE